jgi:FkbM family methyltransferase
MTSADTADFGAFAPGLCDRAVMAVTRRLPDNWIGLRLAILLRRLVTTRLAYPDGALDVERWGLRMRLHPRDNGCEKNLLFTPRMYEPVELAALEAEIARAKGRAEPFLFVDIGANVGLFSLFVAARAGQAARILAIEPELGNVRRLEYNVGANPGVPIKIISCALSDEAGYVAIELNRRDRGGTRTRKLAAAEAFPHSERVCARTLLELLATEQVEAVDALKIDVEGFEDSILGKFIGEARSCLLPRLIIIEDSRASWNVDLISIMAARGYRLVTCTTRHNLLLRRDGQE